MIEIDIDALCSRCGYFTSECDVNNGYGCRHPEIEGRDENAGLGCCLASACPLGWLSDDDESSVCLTEENAKGLGLI